MAEMKIEKGESVNPHLNSATKKDQLDGLLYDWGIHHLHLGETFSAPGYVERTGPVLFAIFRKDDVYFIDIRNHEGWSDKNLLEIVNRNWPELLSIYKMEGVMPETSFPYTLYSSLIRTEFGHTVKVIACCNNVPGMQATSVTASFLLSRFELDVLFMTGFCAGFKKDGVNYGDLFIADSEYDYGSGKLVKNEKNEQTLMPEPKQIPCGFDVLSKLNDFISEESFASKIYEESKRKNLLIDGMNIPNLYVSPGACGSYVVGDKEFMQRLLDDDNRKLRGLDMEGYGLYLAGHMLKKNCVLIKGIADFGDSEKGDIYHKVCSYTSAWFVSQYIKKRM